MAKLSREGKAKLKLLRSDFLIYAPRCLNIRTKTGDIVPLKLNTAQRYLHKTIEDQIARTGKVRKVVLKGRQQGASTYTEGRFYYKVSNSRGKQAFILTHEAEATKNLFGMARRYHELCPRVIRPHLGEDSAKAMFFSKLESGYRVGTAGNKGAGRSATNQFLHGSEVAFWPNAEEHLAGLLQTVPKMPGTEVILESTANGEGGVYYDYVMDARAGRGEFELVFIPWFVQQEYRSKVPPDFVVTDQEAMLQRLYKLDLPQLQWRREKVWELKSEELFFQEYPCNIDEAFRYSGRPVFDPRFTEAAILECFSPIRKAEVEPSSGMIISRDDGLLSIWDEPRLGEHYVIGADVAEGLIHGDYSCADVLDSKGNQVAQWHGHVDPERFGHILAALGKFYRKAFIGVERNNHGLTTLTALKNVGYTDIYVQEDIERQSDGKQMKKIGWLTTSKSKPFIIDQLATRFRDLDTGIVCRETIDECRTYIIEENGSYAAKPKCYDDRVMSMAIAIEMLRRRPLGGTIETFRNSTNYQPVSRGGY